MVRLKRATYLLRQDSGNMLYAVQTSSMGLADSPWPKIQANNQNTGCSTCSPTYTNELRETHIPKEFYLHQNYPNPFNPTTVIKYDILQYSHIQMTIYDILGREITRLLDEQIPPGQHRIIWDATSENGEQVSAGLYFCHMKAGGYSKIQKMLFIK